MQFKVEEFENHGYVKLHIWRVTVYRYWVYHLSVECMLKSILNIKAQKAYKENWIAFRTILLI